MSRLLTIFLTLLAVGTLMLSGCGDDAQSSSEGGTTESGFTEATETETERTDGTVDSSDTSNPEVTEGDSGGEDTGGDGGPRSLKAFCEYNGVSEALAESGNDSLEEMRDGYTAYVEAFEVYASLAPSEIASDVETLLELHRAALAAIGEAATLEEAQTAFQEPYTDPEAVEANSRLAQWYLVDDNCPE